MNRKIKNWVVQHDTLLHYIRFSRKMPMQQLRGAIRRKRLEAILPLKEECEKFPTTLTIETTNICNAFCTFCPHPKMKRTQTIMIMSLYEKLIKEAKENGVEEVVLSFFGEPFCDRDILKRIAIAKKAGLRVILYTNAISLDNATIEELISLKLDRIFISLDSFSAEHYKKIRLVGKYDDVVENIKQLILLKFKRKADLPYVEIGMLLLGKVDKSEIKKFQETWKKADNLVIREAHKWLSDGVVIKNKLPCYPLWNNFYVLCDGRVVPCCMDYEGTVVLGDTNKQTLKEIWNGEPFKRVRKMHMDNQQDKLEICKKCTVIHSTTYPWWYFK